MSTGRIEIPKGMTDGEIARLCLAKLESADWFIRQFLVVLQKHATSRETTPYSAVRDAVRVALGSMFADRFDRADATGWRRRMITVVTESLFARHVEKISNGVRFSSDTLDDFRAGYNECFRNDTHQFYWLLANPGKSLAEYKHAGPGDYTYDPEDSYHQPQEISAMTTATQATLSVPAMEQRTFIYGRPASEYTNDQIVDVIKQLEDEIERCKAVKNKPKHLKKAIEQMQSNIQALVEFSDTRE